METRWRDLSWRAKRRIKKQCWHHDLRTGDTYVVGQLVDLGRAKIWWCVVCKKTWT